MKYVIDSSAILAGAEFGNYEKEYFNHYWENLDKKIQNGIIVSTERVYNEILNKDDDISIWARENRSIFQIPSPDVLKLVGALHKTFPKWYGKNKNKENWADSQIIAFAKHHNIVLVTQEGWNWNAKSDKKFKIPTICSKLGACCHIGQKFDPGIGKNKGFQCIDFLELIKREKLHEMI